VQETVEVVPAEVKAEPDLYKRIGEERTFEVDVTPPKLFKREIVRPIYRHRLDRNRTSLLREMKHELMENVYVQVHDGA
jgi:transposase